MVSPSEGRVADMAGRSKNLAALRCVLSSSAARLFVTLLLLIRGRIMATAIPWEASADEVIETDLGTAARRIRRGWRGKHNHCSAETSCESREEASGLIGFASEFDTTQLGTCVSRSCRPNNWIDRRGRMLRSEQTFPNQTLKYQGKAQEHGS